MKVISTFAVIMALAMTLPCSFAQEPPEPPEEELDIDDLDREYDPTPEMEDPMKLLEEILEKMKIIEEMLSRASVGEAYQHSKEVVDELEKALDEEHGSDSAAGALEEQKEVIKKIEKLLEPCENKQEEVINDLDKLIEIIQALQQQTSSSGGGQSQGEKPQQSEEKQEKDKRMKPDKPPQDGKQEHKPGDPAERPYDPSVDFEEESPPPAELPIDAIEERWGLLPPHIRDEIRQAYQTEFPEEYKALIEEYYRRLSER